ncbi:acyltransferase [Mycolicibacterium novocastrense]|nr:acyltransferase [Mycolicibacterium novocastrense]
MYVGQAFDPRNNALNSWRLVLASGVILLHAYLLTKEHLPDVHQFLRDGWVDGFFAISGFLITASWLKKPQPRVYFIARGLRILPGLWVCLVVTAFVFAPATGSVSLPSQIGYVLKNGTLVPLQASIDGTPATAIQTWNGNLWTLLFEALCYALVAALGFMRLLNKWFVLAAFVATLAWSQMLPPWSVFGEMMETGEPISPETFMVLIQAVTARLLIMFLAGALLYLFRDHIPASWSLVAVAAVVVVASTLVPNYRSLAAIPLAYVLVVSGALIRHRVFQLPTDLSYGVYIYGFPLQQLLLFAGLDVHPLLFALISVAVTLPMAALSWFFVEKPALRLKNRIKRRESLPVGAVDPTIPLMPEKGGAAR